MNRGNGGPAARPITLGTAVMGENRDRGPFRTLRKPVRRSTTTVGAILGSRRRHDVINLRLREQKIAAAR